MQRPDRQQQNPVPRGAQDPEASRTPGQSQPSQLSDEAIEAVKRQRFQQRVQRVLAVMREERIDWRGLAFVTPDGRIGVQVMPVEMNQPPGEATKP